MEAESEQHLRTFVMEAMSWWFAAGRTGVHRVVQGLRLFSEQWPSFSWSSACSGSELYAKSLRDAESFLAARYGIAVQFPIVYACDNNAEVQQWLLEQYDPKELPLIFNDIQDC